MIKGTRKKSSQKILLLMLMAATLAGTTSCDFLFGTMDDPTVDEIFDQGAIDPTIVPEQVGYVPILPVWGAFSNPVDVFVGYDHMVYVVDDNGLNILDQKGEKHLTIPMQGAIEVTQDRMLQTYVSGRADVMVNGVIRSLPAVYKFINTATGNPEVVDTILHPFDDISRRNIGYRSADLQVSFTGLATRADNVLYVARTGPVNDPNSVARPDNAILFFGPQGNNIGYAIGLNSVSPDLKSVLGVSSIATFAAPPQRLIGVSTSNDFIIAQAAQDRQVEYRVLWIREQFDPDQGVQYLPNTELLNMPDERAGGFLYEPYRFSNPQDVFIAPDADGYIFVVDSEKDSLYQFTRQGYEGVVPPPTFPGERNLLVSFGGRGAGPFQFNQPSGICYYQRTIYVADKGNNRIMRYRLNTHLE